MPYKICPGCKIEFYVYPSQFHRRKYCSINCLGKNRIKRAERLKVVCANCKKEFFRRKKFIQLRKKQKNHFCSKKCFNKFFSGKGARPYYSGKNNPNWAGGKTINSEGYVQIKTGRRTKSGYEMEHRIIMEKHTRRKLNNNEEVHHINGVKTDNRIENLKIVMKKCHFGEVKCPYCQKKFEIK